MSTQKLTFKKCGDLILGIFLLALSVVYIIFARQIQTRPKMTPTYANAQVLPTLLGILLAILSAALIYQGIRSFKKDDGTAVKKMSKVDLVSVVLTFAAMCLYIVILPKFGFILSTVVFLFAQITILAPKEKRNLPLFAIVAVIFTIIAFIAFRIGLSQMLPRGPIEALLGY